MKERMLTVLVPIKDSDATIVETLPSVDVDNINIIYKHEGVYKRLWLNPSTNQYEYREVVDREFPYIGKPMEIFNFTYDSTRMGPAPTISAQGVMWFADKDENGEDVTLEGLWNQECHVTFNGENFYLKLIPTSTKDNEDARYKYDLDFVSERVVLENVYLYDVVQPYITETPVSESATFSFFGDVSELIKRINASLLRSGLATIALKNGVSQSDVLTYEEWNQIGQGIYDGLKPTSRLRPGHPIFRFYPSYQGDYRLYLLNEVYVVQNPQTYHTGGSIDGYDVIFDGDLTVNGYQCRLGKDDKGEMTTSEEALISFDNVTIYQALQEVKEKFGLQYYITREKDSQGEFTGNTIIMVADCEHDFADWDEDNDDFVRGDDGLPKTDNPFDYGSEDALLSKEKSNTTEQIVTRMTGTGSGDNIPWYYPNPTGDGWLRPVFKRDGEEVDVDIDYPATDDYNTAINTPESVRYEKYLKNRIGDVFQYGRQCIDLDKTSYISGFSVVINGETVEYRTKIETQRWTFCYYFYISRKTKVKANFALSNLTDYPHTKEYRLFKDGVEVTSSDYNYLLNGGEGFFDEGDEGEYNLVYVVNFTTAGPTVSHTVLYYYPETSCPFILRKSVNTNVWKKFLTWLLAPTTVLTEIVLSKINYWQMVFGNGSSSVQYTGFFSTKPNLRFVKSDNILVQGWWDGPTRIDWSDTTNYIVPQKNSTVYAFPGGSGEKTIGVDPISKITYGDTLLYTLDATYGLNRYNSYGLGWYPLDTNERILNFLRAWAKLSPPATSYKMKSREDDVQIDVETILTEYVTISIDGHFHDGWYKGTRKVDLDGFGIDNEDELSQNSDTIDEIDTIEFQRVKYVTPQMTLMPEVYIKTDGANRFYNAHNYYKDNHLLPGSADTTIGEEQVGANVRNPIYKEDESGSDSLHYDFENEYIQTRPHEYIEKFDDVRPSIKGQTFFTPITISFADFTIPNDKYYGKNDDGTYSLLSTYPVLPTQNAEVYITQRIDVVETFAYDELDNDEIWESENDGNVSGEYKHPYFFAKLRPMGFNLFDLALQEDMVLSMTTGHCGACNFKIGVDENTLKNPVQIWQYDVYHKEGLSYTKVYNKGDLRRYIDVTDLYYKIDGIYQDVQLYSSNTVGFLVPESYSEGVYKVADFDETDVAEGRVGNLKNKSKIVFEGDVVVNGRFIDSQQDTSENYVWVALYKDTESYGTLMPSANPDYIDDNYSRYIEPKGHIYNNRKSGQTEILDDDDADKFVLVNIRMPQAYLRRAEHELSRQIVKYMFDHNYQKYNFSIKFSRIFLAQNESIDNDLNENSVLYVNFNRKTYRQYVKHYSYRMSEGDVLPEITVDLNEELLPTRTMAEKEAAAQSHNIALAERRMRGDLRSVESRITKRVVGKNDTVVVRGNIVNRDSAGSLVGLQNARQVADRRIFDTELDTERLDGSVGSLGQNVDSVGMWAVDVEYFMTIVRETMEHRLQAQCQQTASGDYAGLWYDEDGQITTPTATCYSPTIPELDING